MERSAVRWTSALVLAVALAFGAFTVMAQDGPQVVYTDEVPYPAVGYLAGHLIVGLAPSDGLSALTPEGRENARAVLGELNARFGVEEMRPLVSPSLLQGRTVLERLSHVYLVELPVGTDPLVAARAYEESPHVAYAEPDYVCPLYEVPNDPSFHQQWGLHQQSDHDVDAPEAWDLSTGDTTVVLGITDTGVDWDHPDLVADLWINALEDINGNGEFDNYDYTLGGDLDNDDDDGNGYIDDVIGWDFVSLSEGQVCPGEDYTADNDPMDFDGHGTHVAGISAAVTNNGIGVAGLGRDCRIMPLRMGWSPTDCGQGLVSMTFAVSGIAYAVQMGATAVNMSWGASGVSIMDACREAYAAGVAMVHAAGNDNGNLPTVVDLMADTTLSVAATNSSDVRAGFSNYGQWVDVSAPGVGIYSTIFNDGYTDLGGTSMAAPFVTGLAGLIRAQDPGVTIDGLMARIKDTAEDIDPLNPGYEGMLGTGRINAYRALGSHLYSFIDTEIYWVDDAGAANPDDRAEVGETVDFIVQMRNYQPWLDAASIEGRLRTDDPDITIVDSVAAFPDMFAGWFGSNSSNPFRFRVDGGEPRWVTFVLWKDADNPPPPNNREDTLMVLIDHPAVLLVDDDGGDDTEEAYEAVLGDTLGIMYDIWDVAEQGSPDSYLPTAELVIWFTSDESESTLTGSDMALLSSFLDGGGQLFLTGTDIAEEISGEPFLSDYLGAFLTSPASSALGLFGVGGDPIGDSMLVVVDTEPTKDVLGLVGDADSCFYYESGGTAGLRYDAGTHRVVFFGFGWEAINDAPPPPVSDKWEVMERVLVWLNPLVGVCDGPGEGGLEVPMKLELAQNHPNPVRTRTAIGYSVPAEGGSASQGVPVEITIYNILGQQVRTLVDGPVLPGRHVVYWDRRDGAGQGVASGVYFYHLQAGRTQATRKMVVIE